MIDQVHVFNIVTTLGEHYACDYLYLASTKSTCFSIRLLRKDWYTSVYNMDIYIYTLQYFFFSTLSGLLSFMRTYIHGKIDFEISMKKY